MNNNKYEGKYFIRKSVIAKQDLKNIADTTGYINPVILTKKEKEHDAFHDRHCPRGQYYYFNPLEITHKALEKTGICEIFLRVFPGMYTYGEMWYQNLDKNYKVTELTKKCLNFPSLVVSNTQEYLAIVGISYPEASLSGYTTRKHVSVIHTEYRETENIVSLLRVNQQVPFLYSHLAESSEDVLIIYTSLYDFKTYAQPWNKFMSNFNKYKCFTQIH